jgi:major type 1 subunit fimbrin (pilin)
MQSKRSFGRALVVAAAVIAAPLSCVASDGTITISGIVKAETCNIASLAGATAGTSSFAVVLPTVSAQMLSATPAAGRTRFTLKLSGCTGFSSGNLFTFFEHGPLINANGRLSLATGSVASGFDIEIQNSAGVAMVLNAVSGAQNDIPVAVSGNNADLTYYAQYKPTSTTITSGAWSTNVNYVIVYP